jgi:hypothetical protein
MTTTGSRPTVDLSGDGVARTLANPLREGLRAGIGS